MANYGYGGGYNTTSSAQGGADGGGFMAGSQAGSQDTPSGAKTYGKDTIRPVTIKQIEDAIIPHQNADPKIDGADITQLSLIGQIIRVEAQATNTTYTLDDGTGTFQVKKWIDGDAAPEDEDASLKEGQYVHVWGRIKDFNGKRHVISHIIRPITDYNEISAHLLEATAVHLYFTRGPVDAQNGAAARSEGMFVDSYGDAKNGAAAVGNRLPAGMSALSKSVFKVLEEAPQNNEGLNIQHIAQQLKASAIDVHKAGDELLQHGLIYTTIDDETWAVLE